VQSASQNVGADLLALTRESAWQLLGYAVAESFFSSLKKERIAKQIYKTCDLAKADVFDDIEVFYS